MLYTNDKCTGVRRVGHDFMTETDKKWWITIFYNVSCSLELYIGKFNKSVPYHYQPE